MKWSLLLLGTVVLAVGGCRRHDDHGAPVAASPAPLPATPPRLLAEGTLSRPDAAWTEVQKQLGTLGAFLPATFSGVVGSALDLDRELTVLVDGTAPLYFAVEAGELPSGKTASPPTVSWALALPVRDAARVATQLGAELGATAGGEGGDGETKVYPLHPRLAAAGGAVPADDVNDPDADRLDAPVLARVVAAPRFLLVASSRAAAQALAPYITRALPESKTMVASADDARALRVNLPHTALAGALPMLVASRWAEARAELAEEANTAREHHGGRAPDFADPDAVLKLADGVVERALAFVADVDHALFRLEIGDEQVSAQLTLTPVPGGTIAAPGVGSLAACDLAPLSAESLDSAAAALVCSHEDDRVSFAESTFAAVRDALGPRLPAADGERLHRALVDLAHQRGDGLGFTMSPGGVVRLDMPVAVHAGADGDADAGAGTGLMQQAVRTLVDLAHMPGFAEPLAADLGVRVRPSRESSAAIERVHGATATPAGVIGWKIETGGAGRLVVAAGPSLTAAPLLAPPTRALSDDARLAALLGALGKPSFALVVQPQMATSVLAEARPHAAVALAYGPSEGHGEAQVRLVADAGLARSLARLLAGF